jgi:hypothetical protein
MSLDAFGATAISTSLCSIEEEKGGVQLKRARIEFSAPSSLGNLQDQIQTMLRRKSQVLGQVLPEARKNLATIERALISKIKRMRESDFERATELAVSLKTLFSLLSLPLSVSLFSLSLSLSVSLSLSLSLSPSESLPLRISLALNVYLYLYLCLLL